MKKLMSIILIGTLAASTLLVGCSIKRKSSNTTQPSASNSAATEAVTEATKEASTEAKSTENETTNQDTSAAEDETGELVVFDDNGIKLTYTGYKEDIFPAFTFRIENSSDKSYMVSTKDVSLNDCMLTTSIIETVAPGKKSNVKMNMLKSDLEDNGITTREKLEFKLHCTNSEDFLDSFDSDVIVINNP